MQTAAGGDARTAGPWCWTWEETVQYADLDTNDHVNNVVFLRWMQETRVSYFRNRLAPQLLEHGEQLSLVVGESSVTYLRPIFFPERVVLRMALASIGTSAFSFDYEIIKKAPHYREKDTEDDRKEILCGTGSARLVCIDPASQRKAAISPVLRRLLEADQAQTDKDRFTSASGPIQPQNPAQGSRGPLEVENWPICWVHKEARVNWLGEVRRELKKIAPGEEFDAVTAAATIQYLSPMLYEEEARVYVRMLQLGTTSIVIEHVVVRRSGSKTEVCYRCTARLVAFDHDKQSKMTISPSMRQALERVERRHQQPQGVRSSSATARL